MPGRPKTGCENRISSHDRGRDPAPERRQTRTRGGRYHRAGGRRHDLRRLRRAGDQGVGVGAGGSLGGGRSYRRACGGYGVRRDRILDRGGDGGRLPGPDLDRRAGASHGNRAETETRAQGAARETGSPVLRRRSAPDRPRRGAAGDQEQQTGYRWRRRVQWSRQEISTG